MIYCLQSGVVNHFVVVQVEQLMKLKNLLPVDGFNLFYFILVISNMGFFFNFWIEVAPFHVIVPLLLETAHFHFEDSSKGARIRQYFPIGRLGHMTVKVDGSG